MKKILLVTVLTTMTIMANTQFAGCSEVKLNETKSIVSCLNADYEITFKVDSYGKRIQSSEPKIKILSIQKPDK